MPSLASQSRALRQLAVAAALLVAPRAALLAQGPTVAATQSALSRCSYETCALRLDRSFFGGRRVVSGLEGVSSPMGLVGGGLVNAVYAVPAALTEAQMGRRNAIKSSVAGLIGALALAYSLQGTRDDILGWNDTQVFGGLAVGVAASLTGLQQSLYAERHFSRAVWLYNREIPR